MLLNEVLPYRLPQPAVDKMMDQAYHHYGSLSPEEFHETFIHYFGEYFTNVQIDSGKMDEEIGRQWEMFSARHNESV